MSENFRPPDADLDACEREPLAFSGQIQNVGGLLATSSGSNSLTHLSDNLAQWFDLPPDQGRIDMQALFFDDCDYFVHRQRALSEHGHYLIANVITNRGIEGDLIFSRQGDHWLYEFEARGAAEPAAAATDVSVTFADKTLPEDLPIEAVLRDIHALTRYPKAMLYRFLPDGSGEVVAELSDAALDKYQGLRFPASDIPQIARKLYIENPFRLIFDTQGTQSAIRVLGGDATLGRPEALDLSHSGLRSVSPVHVEYLHNMGIRSSASFPIVVLGRLWGLVALHAVEPTPIAVADRVAVRKLVDRGLARRLMDAQINEDHRRFNASVELLRNSAAALRALRTETPALPFRPPAELHALIPVDGMVVRLNGQTLYRDELVSQDEAAVLAALGHGQTIRGQFATDTLTPFLDQSDDFKRRVSGMLYSSTGDPGQPGRVEVLWLRSEQSQSVIWAGKPEKIRREIDGEVRVSPRQSFAAWQATTSGQAMSWKSSDLLLAAKLIVQLMSRNAG